MRNNFERKRKNDILDMRLYNQNHLVTVLVSIALSIILCNNQFVESQSGSLDASASAGAASGSGPGSSGAQASLSGSVGGASLSAAGSASSSQQGSSGNSGGSSGSSAASGSSSPNAGMSASGSASLDLNGNSSSASASASANLGSTTPKPGLFSKVKDILKEGKEIFTGEQKLSVNASTSTSTGKESSASASANLNIGSSGGSGSSSTLGASLSGSSGGSSSSSASAQASLSVGVGKGSKSEQGSSKSEQSSDGGKKEGFMDKVEKTVSKGTELVKDSYHKLEDRARDIKDDVSKAVDENVVKPMRSVEGSGSAPNEGEGTAHAKETASLRGPDRSKYFDEIKSKQESEVSRPPKLKDIIQDAKRRGIIPLNEDRSVLKGEHVGEKSVAVDVFDRAHEMSKVPVEKLLKPIDKMFGYEKDPLVRMYDNVHEVMRKPLGVVSKPVESVLNGAFKTSDESKKETEKSLMTKSEQERREFRIEEEKFRNEDRSITGLIADKTVELATKPIEIILRPVDHFFGYDKPGKKNPFLKLFDKIYGISKKPVDGVVKPFESILKKMGEDEKLYQVSIRFQNERDNSDPKLVSRLADGALNIADRVLTKPLEIFLRPMDKALGYDDPGKKNPLVEAAHSLKNATKLGIELFTKPIDRILKEIHDVSRTKSEAEAKSFRDHQKEVASRLVKIMDKSKNLAQVPFEIVLRPIGKILGTSKEGQKGPLLRVWDYIHQLIRAPIQIIGKPIEEALLGEQEQNRKLQSGVRVEAKLDGKSSTGRTGSGGEASFKAKADIKASGSGSSSSNSGGETKVNAKANASSDSNGGSTKIKASASLNLSKNQ